MEERLYEEYIFLNCVNGSFVERDGDEFDSLLSRLTTTNLIETTE
jgi:hypothetical protein